jgi:predicted secreted protein
MSALAIWTFGYGQQEPVTRLEPKTITATLADSSDTVQVARDDSLVLRLESQPGTGYSWRITHHDTLHLRLLGEEWVPGEAAVPGGVEHQIFRFAALKADSSRVELHYARPWEKGTPPVKTYRLQVDKP